MKSFRIGLCSPQDVPFWLQHQDADPNVRRLPQSLKKFIAQLQSGSLPRHAYWTKDRKPQIRSSLTTSGLLLLARHLATSSKKLLETSIEYAILADWFIFGIAYGLGLATLG